MLPPTQDHWDEKLGWRDNYLLGDAILLGIQEFPDTYSEGYN